LYSLIVSVEINIPLLPWFLIYASKSNLLDKSLNTSTSLAYKWTLKNQKVVRYVIPLSEEIVITTFEMPTLVTPFNIGTRNLESSSVSLEYIKKVYHQNNYTIQILYVASKQLNMLSTQIKAIAKKNHIECIIEQMEEFNIDKDEAKPKSEFLNDIGNLYFKTTYPTSLNLQDKFKPLDSKID